MVSTVLTDIVTVRRDWTEGRGFRRRQQLRLGVGDGMSPGVPVGMIRGASRNSVCWESLGVSGGGEWENSL